MLSMAIKYRRYTMGGSVNTCGDYFGGRLGDPMMNWPDFLSGLSFLPIGDSSKNNEKWGFYCLTKRPERVIDVVR